MNGQTDRQTRTEQNRTEEVQKVEWTPISINVATLKCIHTVNWNKMFVFVQSERIVVV